MLTGTSFSIEHEIWDSPTVGVLRLNLDGSLVNETMDLGAISCFVVVAVQWRK